MRETSTVSQEVEFAPHATHQQPVSECFVWVKTILVEKGHMIPEQIKIVNKTHILCSTSRQRSAVKSKESAETTSPHPLVGMGPEVKKKKKTAFPQCLRTLKTQLFVTSA